MEVTWKERRRVYEGGGGDGGGGDGVGGGSGDGGAATGGIGIGERGKRRDIMENQGRSHGSDSMRKKKESVLIVKSTRFQCAVITSLPAEIYQVCSGTGVEG
uniref:Uncharacterized protein n=1 Tax=Vespula pensylvanica TaxID=30213 RepID=A0A834U7N3_VESPE|nr:hypothetical protein H0235_010440 [Vespula pensylvanica]